MSKFYDEDGIDGPFEKAMAKAMRQDKKKRIAYLKNAILRAEAGIDHMLRELTQLVFEAGLKSHGPIKTVDIATFATDEMLELARKIGPDVRRICSEVITPNMDEIDRKLGQKNDAMYLSYAMVYALEKTQ